MTAGELLTPVVWAGATHLAMWSAGAWLRARLAPAVSREEGAGAALESAMLGLALLGTGALALGEVGLLAPWLVALAVGALAATGIARLARHRRLRMPRPAAADVPLIACLAFVAIRIPAALYPVLEHDENVYHLLLPKLYLASHRVVALPWSLGANMPHLVDLSYVLPTAWGGFTAAKVFAIGCIVWTIAGLAPFGRAALGPMGPGVLATLYLSGRVIQWHLGLAYVEPVIGAMLLGAAHAFVAWRRDGDPGRLRILGVLAGAACAAKYTVWPAAAVLILLAGWHARPRRWRAVAATAGLAALLVVPWVVKDAVVTGDPLFPNLTSVFPTPYWSPVQETQFQHEMGYGRGASRSPLDYVTLPLRLVTDPYTGRLGTASFSAVFMLLFVAAFAFPWRASEPSTDFRIVAAAAFVAWSVGSQQGRYLVAWLPIMIIVAGSALAPIRGKAPALAAVTVVTAVVAIAQVRLQPFPVIPSLDVFTAPRSELLSRNLCWDLTEFLNRTVPKDGRVLSFWENRLYFLERPFVTDSAYGAPTVLARLRDAGDPHAFATMCAAEGFTHVVINPYHYKSYMGNGYLYDMIDARDYPRERLEADHALLDRFVNDELEGVPWDGGWAVFRLRPTGSDAAR